MRLCFIPHLYIHHSNTLHSLLNPCRTLYKLVHHSMDRASWDVYQTCFIPRCWIDFIITLNSCCVRLYFVYSVLHERRAEERIVIELFTSENRDWEDLYYQARVTTTNGDIEWYDPALRIVQDDVEIIIDNGHHNYHFNTDIILKIELFEISNLIDKNGFDYRSESFVRNILSKE